MDCPTYLALFSDERDGVVEAEVARQMETHREACERCREYSRTIEAGVQLLRSLPTLEVPPEFRPRLHHRILHADDPPWTNSRSLGSGATVVSVLSVAILATLAAWAPTLVTPEPTAEVPPLVVADPPEKPFSAPPATPTFPRNLSIFTTTEFQEGIWGDSHDLLREYSPIMERRRDPTLVRVGIE